MPEPNHRPPWQIEDGLGAQTIRQMLDRAVTLTIECDACSHRANWGPEELGRRFGRKPARCVAALAARLRCSKCRSEWIKIYVASPETATSKETS